MPHDTTPEFTQPQLPYPKLCECGCGELAPLAPYTSERLGIVKGEPRRFVNGHSRRGKGRPVADRLWEKVDKHGPIHPALGTACWIWQGTKAKDGYGLILYEDRKCVIASRVAYMLTHGPIPDGLYICHHCDNPACCNPAHLFLGTPADNMRDHAIKGRSGIAKCSHDDVRQIRKRFAAGETQTDLAREFGVSNMSMHCIVRRKTYRYIE